MPEKVLLINEVPADSLRLRKGIELSGYVLLNELSSTDQFIREINSYPVAVIFNFENPFASRLKTIVEMNLANLLPVIVFVNAASKQEIEQSIKNGIQAFIVNGLESGRIPAILDTAIVRFEQQKLKNQELDYFKRSLSDRKIIERAKGVLMDTRGMKENDAYKSLRKMAMDQNKRLVDVCNDVIEMFKYIA